MCGIQKNPNYFCLKEALTKLYSKTKQKTLKTKKPEDRKVTQNTPKSNIISKTGCCYILERKDEAIYTTIIY